MKKLNLSIVLILLYLIPIYSQEVKDEWKIFGQLQLRGELDGRDFLNETNAFSFCTMRTHLGVKKTLMNQIDFFVEISDSRVFGQERNTIASINNVDLHQGFLKLHNILELPIDVQAGRFEVSYGTERFIGASNWHYIGRSFDGIRFSVDSELINLDLFSFIHTQTLPYIGNPTPSTYPISASRDYFIYGFWKNTKIDDYNKFDVIGYYEFHKEFSSRIDTIYTNRYTVGTSYWGNLEDISLTVEAAYQFGKNNGRDLSAYLVSLLVLYKPDIFNLGIGADIFSGTKSSETKKDNSFENNLGSNHKFFGYMDYFNNIPANTNGLGLNDFYFTSSYKFGESKFFGQLNAHHFMSNQKSSAGESSFGQEIDLVLKYDFIQGTAISWGSSVFLPGDLMKIFWKSGSKERENPSFWTYLMVTTNIN